MSVEPVLVGLPSETEVFRATAARVLRETERWIDGGLGDDTALALAQNALPLVSAADGDLALQQRSHARVLVALLMFVPDDSAGELATGLVEALAGCTAVCG